MEKKYLRFLDATNRHPYCNKKKLVQQIKMLTATNTLCKKKKKEKEKRRHLQ